MTIIKTIIPMILSTMPEVVKASPFIIVPDSWNLILVFMPSAIPIILNNNPIKFIMGIKHSIRATIPSIKVAMAISSFFIKYNHLKILIILWIIICWNIFNYILEVAIYAINI